jgi:hypothetical protein
MGDALNQPIEEAGLRGEALRAHGSLATAAVYDAAAGVLRLSLANGVEAAIPAALIEGLAEATEADRAGVEIAGVGYGLHWPALDLDLSVPGLLAGVFGTQSWSDSRRAARAGAATSPAKSAAARRNGAKGGRPRKSLP